MGDRLLRVACNKKWVGIMNHEKLPRHQFGKRDKKKNEKMQRTKMGSLTKKTEKRRS